MKKNKLVLILLITTCIIMPIAYAQSNISKDKVPLNIQPYEKEQIEKLHSKTPSERLSAVGGLLSEAALDRDVTAAIPSLIELLNDATSITTTIHDFDGTQRQEVGPLSEYVIKLLAKIGKPAVGPLIAALNNSNQDICKNVAVSLRQITNQDFGKDTAKWQEWWEKSKGDR